MKKAEINCLKSGIPGWGVIQVLEEVNHLPETVVHNLAGVEGLKVYLVQDFNLDLLKRMVDFSSNIFGESGVGEWSLVPQIKATWGRNGIN